jgi:hypothetical protein
MPEQDDPELGPVNRTHLPTSIARRSGRGADSLAEARCQVNPMLERCNRCGIRLCRLRRLFYDELARLWPGPLTRGGFSHAATQPRPA